MPNASPRPTASSRSPRPLSPDFHDGESSSPVVLSYPSSRQLSPNPTPVSANISRRHTPLPPPPSSQPGPFLSAKTGSPNRNSQRTNSTDIEAETWGAQEHDWGAHDEHTEEDAGTPSHMQSSSQSRPATVGMSHQPLLGSKKEQPYRESYTSHRSTFHERDPESASNNATKTRYIYAGGFLVLSLISFVVQTETAVYIQHELGWAKPYCMLYLTHGSWTVLWFLLLLILRIQKREMPWSTFWRRHVQILRQTALMVQHQDLSAPQKYPDRSPVSYMLRTIVTITCALTVAGGSWYVAVDLTTADDLTAIYNCSAFFAYVFSIFLLKEKVRPSKVISVLIAVAGVFVVAYGGASSASPDDGSSSKPSGSTRAIGNLVISVGSVLYGFYEVLYKRMACPPDGTSPGRSMIFANMIGTCMGIFTLTVLWIPIPILHYTGLEIFELPRGDAAWLLLISTFSNAVFSGSFLVLISLTSPVLSSVAALLTIFLVALVDQLLPPPLYNPLSNAAIVGGCLIIGAFAVLSWATYREMDEEREKKPDEEVVESDVEE